jgi:hypothetical protein
VGLSGTRGEAGRGWGRSTKKIQNIKLNVKMCSVVWWKISKVVINNYNSYKENKKKLFSL